MILKKFLLSVLVSSILIFPLTTILGAQTKVLKLAHVNTITQPIHLTCIKLAELVKERTENRVQINVFPAGQLGSNPEIFQGVQFGTIDMGVIPPPALADIVPEYAIFDAGYIFRDVEHYKKVVNGPIAQELEDKLVKNGEIRVLGTELLGVRHLTTTNKPVYSPEDLKGMKIRAVEFPVYLETIKGMGATPTAVSFSELFGALQQGIVDGQENPIPSIWSAKLHVVQKYLMLTGHIISGLTIAINEGVYQGLSEEDQRILKESTIEAIAYGEEILNRQEAELLDELRKEGMTVIDVEQGLKIDEFRERTRSHILSVYSEKWGEDLYDRIQSVE